MKESLAQVWLTPWAGLSWFPLSGRLVRTVTAVQVGMPLAGPAAGATARGSSATAPIAAMRLAAG